MRPHPMAAPLTRAAQPRRTTARLLIPLVAAAMAASPGGARGEDPSPAAARAAQAAQRLGDSDGGRLVLRAIEAHGGLEAWYGKRTGAFSWEYYNFAIDLRFRSHQTVDLSSRRVYHDLALLGKAQERTPATGRFAWDGRQAWIHPAQIERIEPRFWALTPFYFQFIPFVLADPGAVYEALPPEVLDGVTYDMVRVGFAEGVGDAPGDTYTLYVDRTSGRVEAIRYTVTYFGPSVSQTLFDYEEFATVDGLTLATRYEGYPFADGQKGPKGNGAIAADLAFDVPFDQARLALPEGGRVQPLPGR